MASRLDPRIDWWTGQGHCSGGSWPASRRAESERRACQFLSLLGIPTGAVGHRQRFEALERSRGTGSAARRYLSPRSNVPTAAVRKGGISGVCPRPVAGRLGHRCGAMPNRMPGDPRVGRLGDLALEVEVENRLGAAGPPLGEALPLSVARPDRGLAQLPVAHEVDVDVLAVGRPVALEVVEETVPVGEEVVLLEVGQREGEGVVDAP